MLFSAGFFAALLGFGSPAATGGSHGFGVDFAPLGFMVALMGRLVPSLTARAKPGKERSTIVKVAGRSLIVALLAALIAVGGAWMLLVASSPSILSPTSALVVKLAFAALLSLVGTPFALTKLARAARPVA